MPAVQSIPTVSESQADYALFDAIDRHDAAAVSAALEAGANVNKVAGENEQHITSNDGMAYTMPGPVLEVEYTPLQYAIMQSARSDNRLDVLAVLLKDPNIDVNFAGKSAPPLLLAYTHNEPAVDLLLAHPNINVNIGDNSPSNPYGPYSGKSAIHFARTVEQLEKLKTKGADFKRLTNNKETALHWAVGNPETMKWLLDNTDIDVNAPDTWGRTALHGAVSSSHDSAVARILLDHKANVNALDRDDCTPLHAALRYNEKPEFHKENVALLLERGAKVNWYNKEHSQPRTALDMKTKLFGDSWDKEYQPVYDLIKEKGGKHYDKLGWIERHRISGEMKEERKKHPLPDLPGRS